MSAFPALTQTIDAAVVSLFFYRPGPCTAAAAIALDVGRSSAASAGNAIPRRRAMREANLQPAE